MERGRVAYDKTNVIRMERTRAARATPLAQEAEPEHATNTSLGGYSFTARLAQSVERKALNLVVVGSSPTVGVFSQREI